MKELLPCFLHAHIEVLRFRLFPRELVLVNTEEFIVMTKKLVRELMTSYC